MFQDILMEIEQISRDIYLSSCKGLEENIGS